MNELPSVLIDPPWRRSREPTTASSDVVRDLGESPASLNWLAGERERYLGPAPRPVAEQAEERLCQRLLDELDRQKVVPAADLARLGDTRLLEVAEELRACHVDAKSLKLLLARLGDDYLAHAIGLVRVGLPEQGLFDAMAPVWAPELVRRATSLLFHRELPDVEALSRPFVPNGGEAWILRFADMVAPSLAIHDDKPSRTALAWLAASGMGATIPSSHSAFAKPFLSLSALDRPWVAFLAARGHDAQVLALAETPEEVSAMVGFAARALAHRGTSRDAAMEWLFARREIAEPILRGSDLAEARVACALFDGDTTAGDPRLEDVPEAIPALPDFFDPSKLPAPKLTDGTALDHDHVRVLGEMLRFASFSRPYPGITQVRAACEPQSLDDFAVAILAGWKEAGEGPTDLWALECAAKVGGDRAAREVATRVRSWSRGAEPPRHAWDEESHRVVQMSSGDRGWALSRAGCQVLAKNGSDLALTLLDDLSRSGGTSWLRKEARLALDLASEERGAATGRALRPAALVDAIVPDLGLPSNGVELLNLGGRSFVLVFDETLTPTLLSDEGVPQKGFPRLRKDDDKEKYAAAKERFSALGKDTKVLARQQILQLEHAMCVRHSWPLAAFRERFVTHPLLRHLGRRLLWATEDLSTSFRIAEDQSFAGEHDERVEFEAARIVLVHPILLPPETRARWAERFADYEVLQPFPQLGRELFEISDDDVGQHAILRLQGAKASRGRLFQLSRRGWTARIEGEVVEEYFRVLPSGAHATLSLSPPMTMGQGPDAEESFTIAHASSSYTLDRLPSIDFSELVRDVAYLARE